MKQVLEVLCVDTKSGVSKKNGQPFVMSVAQCVLTDLESGDIKVGELTLPKDHPVPVAGKYEATFRIGIDYASKKIGGILVGLSPLPKIPAPPKP